MSRNYSSTAVDTTLTSGVSSANATLAVASTTGFPAAPFVLAVDAGAAAQELVLVTAVGGLSLTVTRGYDSTVAATHEAGATVSHSHAAIDFRESRTHEAATAAHGATGAVVGTTNTQTLTNKTLTSPVINGLASIGGAWTAYVPTIVAGIGPGNGTASGRYIQIGKTVHFWARFTMGSTSVISGTPTLGLPVTAHSDLVGNLQATFLDSGTNNFNGLATLASTTTVSAWAQGGAGGAYGAVSATNPFTFAVNDFIEIRGTYEAA